VAGYATDTPVVLALADPVLVQQMVILVDILDGYQLNQVQMIPLEQ
jgi:hypothetical protein